MPRLSDTMEEGTLATWFKKVGDEVKEGDILAEIETDKATMEFESFYEGTLLYIGIQENETAKVDAPLAVIGSPGEDIKSLIGDNLPDIEPDEKLSNEKDERQSQNVKEKIQENSQTDDVHVVSMPRLSDTMEEGTVANWFKKVGDNIEILFRNEEYKVATGTVANIDESTGTISINNLTNQPNITLLPDPNRDYDLRRVINRASTTSAEIDFGQNILTSDITNVYNDSDKDFYVASNSLPSYQITAVLPKSILPEAVAGNELPNSGYNANTLKYNILSFPSPVPFITGDEIFYTSQGTTLPGLPEGNYFVEVLSNANQIRLYLSRSFIPIADYEEFESLPSGSGTHTFSLVGTVDQQIAAQKLLKKFPLDPSIKNSTSVKTTPGTTGMLINGVEIRNYKSDDKIFFGPLEDVTILNGGSNYDVITPPSITLSGPGAGSTTALIRPVITGNITNVQVDPQDFDIKKVISATIEGGNGSGAIIEPILSERKREITKYQVYVQRIR